MKTDAEIDRARAVIGEAEREDQRTRFLTTAACALVLSVTQEFIRGECKSGRLLARMFRRASGRTAYRIEPGDFDRYIKEHWPRAS